jgi:hypothetical protein
MVGCGRNREREQEKKDEARRGNRRRKTETLLRDFGEVGGIEMFELVGGSRESPCFPLSFGRQSRDTLVLQLSPE